MIIGMGNIERDYAELGVAIRDYASTVAAGGNALRERREVETAITMLAIQHQEVAKECNELRQERDQLREALAHSTEAEERWLAEIDRLRKEK